MGGVAVGAAVGLAQRRAAGAGGRLVGPARCAAPAGGGDPAAGCAVGFLMDKKEKYPIKSMAKCCSGGGMAC